MLQSNDLVTVVILQLLFLKKKKEKKKDFRYAEGAETDVFVSVSDPRIGLVFMHVFSPHAHPQTPILHDTHASQW